MHPGIIEYHEEAQECTKRHSRSAKVPVFLVPLCEPNLTFSREEKSMKKFCAFLVLAGLCATWFTKPFALHAVLLI